MIAETRTLYERTPEVTQCRSDEIWGGEDMRSDNEGKGQWSRESITQDKRPQNSTVNVL